ncbi:hypothetical protein HK100_007606 [Physocladia obscura]|uniref:Single-stranded DNA-binding protein, mitochondrial n=1 Tax=Physocladia obscura TaxID=109957 RepID=A0AAD5TB22_9FUNG|nr:hypothetical protein HK100_007606 [Physocladia obscura]
MFSTSIIARSFLKTSFLGAPKGTNQSYASASNKIVLIGHVGVANQPKTYKTKDGKDGTAYSFTLATTDRFKKNNLLQTVTQWHKVAQFRTTGSWIYESKALARGALVSVEGKINYSVKDGIKYTDIIANGKDCTACTYSLLRQATNSKKKLLQIGKVIYKSKALVRRVLVLVEGILIKYADIMISGLNYVLINKRLGDKRDNKKATTETPVNT